MALPVNTFVLNETFADIGTAETLTFIAPTKGQLVKVETMLAGAITGADETVTVSINGTSVGTITVANAASAAGDLDSLELAYGSVAAGVKAGDRITVATAGNSTGATKAAVNVYIQE